MRRGAYEMLFQRHHGGARQRRIVGEVAFDAGKYGVRQLVLVSSIFQLLLFIGVADESSFHKDGGNVRRLEHGKSRLLYVILVQVVDIANFKKHFLSKLEAIIDSGRLRQIQQGLLEIGIFNIEIDPTDQVRLVFLFCQPPGGGRGRAAFRERIHRGALAHGA